VHAEASMVAWNLYLHNCLSPFLTWADGMANTPKKGKRKKIPPSPPPQKEKTRPLSLVPFIDCMKFLFLKLFVTIFRLGYNPISGTYIGEQRKTFAKA
jgi:hypothetical protein